MNMQETKKLKKVDKKHERTCMKNENMKIEGNTRKVKKTHERMN